MAVGMEDRHEDHLDRQLGVMGAVLRSEKDVDWLE